jgi:hypothetical protein
MSTSDKTAVVGPLGELEKSLCWRLHAACADLGRAQCLDEEQRAEVHAILEAIKHDRPAHALPPIMGQYASVREKAMSERETLQQHFDLVREAILAAAAEYERLAASAANPQDRLSFSRLAREEYRHAGLADRLLEIVNE